MQDYVMLETPKVLVTKGLVEIPSWQTAKSDMVKQQEIVKIRLFNKWTISR